MATHPRGMATTKTQPPLQLTSTCAPKDPKMRVEGGLPFSCIVQPLADGSVEGNGTRSAEEWARCGRCLAYACRYCAFDRLGWHCALCGQYSYYSNQQRKHYGRASSRATLPELLHTDVRCVYAQHTPTESRGHVAEAADRKSVENDERGEVATPATVALVDLAGTSEKTQEKLDVVKSALDAALEAATPGTRFGLASFARDVRLVDARGSPHVVRRVALQPSGKHATNTDLSDVLPVEEFLVSADENRTTLAAAVDLLEAEESRAHDSHSQEPEVAQSDESVDSNDGTDRDFGGALQSMLEYLSDREKDGVAKPAVRLMCFLFGPVRVGRGKVGKNYRNSRGEGSNGLEEEIDRSLIEATGFYRARAIQAAARGIVIDMYILSDQFVDLASMRYLSTQTGGAIHLYPDASTSSLPQDMYKRLTSLQGLLVNMRVRTSPDFRVSRCYGNLYEDEQFENLQHIVVCNKYDTFVLDFEHTSSSGFDKEVQWPPILQLALQYYAVRPSVVTETDGKQKVVHFLRRYLRIVTVPWKVANSIKQLYCATDPDVLVCVLLHKVVSALRRDGIAEARLLLQDWLIILVSHYNKWFELATFGDIDDSQPLDIEFKECTVLQPVLKLVYALLRCPLLSLDTVSSHPDMRMYLQCVYTTLPPALLHRAVYPQLASFSSPGVKGHVGLPLSRTTLAITGSPIFLLDAYTEVIIYYSSTSEEAPFPPPRESLLRKEADALKRDRSISPLVHILMGGKDPTNVFDQHLIEDEGTGLVKNGDVSNLGYSSFMDFISKEVRVYMSSKE